MDYPKVITFTELGNLGRLGNQLFQYAAGRSLSLHHQTDLAIPDPSTVCWHGQDGLLNLFNIKVKYIDSSCQPTQTYREPDYMTVDKNFFNLDNNINISGFFQSIYYFAPYIPQIKLGLSPSRELLVASERYIAHLKQQHQVDYIVSIHLRRGDNTDGSNKNPVLTNTYNPSGFYFNYFDKAKQIFGNLNCKFLIFTGGQRFSDDNSDDMQWCQKTFCGSEYIYAQNNTSIVDFCHIMSCDHNIVCPVSSFGWWAAFLNSNKNKIVVAPTAYHPDRPTYTHREQFYPAEWRLL